MLTTNLLVLALSALGSSSAIKRQSDGRKGILNFLCEGDEKGNMQDVCSNMCYGVYCQGFSSTMYYDRPDGATKKERVKKAGCENPNRCDKAPYTADQECDTFPFVSTDMKDVDKPVNRCVRKEQNKAQHRVLDEFYNSKEIYSGTGLGSKPNSFRLAFANYGLTKYCTFGGNCTNDGNEYTRDGLAELPKKRDLHDNRVNVHQYYVTDSGMQLLVPDGAEVGDVVFTPKIDHGKSKVKFEVDHIKAPSKGPR
ncbi:hypothetical protein K470DRAFT_262689 [Piedraia hortae CBS 480.64]|uniref:Deoxyribonuclease NucA/NucB domain-containing protein n=1 Tax=Piedraia hortae CBS 480.64 TaxID=1314780 RepID=A0A6A7C850_9PEZI|nr:hypothetical protein K470DRAFT_262689 [Piedraia hortae CBS 480.64]